MTKTIALILIALMIIVLVVSMMFKQTSLKCQPAMIQKYNDVVVYVCNDGQTFKLPKENIK